MKRLIKGIAAAGLALATCFAFTACGAKSGAYVNPDESATHSIITKLNLNIDFIGDSAEAKVKNTFTLFPATATVYVYLYYSADYTDDYTAMTELASNYIYDLDMGKTLTASASTVNRGGYYLARMRYKIDSREWKESVTDVYYREGIILQKIEDDGTLPVFEDIEPVHISDQMEEKAILFIAEHAFNPFSGYTRFAEEYLKEFNKPLDKKFFIFGSRTDKYCSNSSPYPSQYALLKNGDNYNLSFNVWLYVDEFGIDSQSQPDIFTGLATSNLELYLNSVNIENKNLNGKLILKFGKGKTENARDFINLYIGDFCFATCFYSTNTVKEIPYAFFYNLFVEGLSII